jgi:hypothetical protein
MRSGMAKGVYIALRCDTRPFFPAFEAQGYSRNADIRAWIGLKAAAPNGFATTRSREYDDQVNKKIPVLLVETHAARTVGAAARGTRIA